MKPLLIILTMLTTALTNVSSANSTYGTSPRPINPVEPKVAPSVLRAFENTFTAAQEADWSISNNHYKVVFAMSGQYVTAFYGTDGSLLGVTRNITSLQLPIALQADLKKEYSEYWISDLFEVTNDEGVQYYVTLENSETKIILKGSASGNWDTFQKSRKA